MQVPVEIKLKTVQTQAGEIEKFELLEQGELTRIIKRTRYNN